MNLVLVCSTEVREMCFKVKCNGFLDLGESLS